MTRAAKGVSILTPSSAASVPGQAQDTASHGTSIASTYIPHVSDLVYPIRDAVNLSDKSIPSLYLEAEAVDSSILLGHALIVEFAEHGTLAQVLSVEKNLDPHMKDLLCLDIARGLSALHRVGLVHGDIKAENILVCSSPDRKYTAKISDFGFSIVAATENNQVWMGGTDPWRAPEIKLGSIQIDRAIKTDIYSFGLLAWVIVLNGGNPFDIIADLPLQKDKIEAIKQDGSLVHKAKGKKWLLRYLQAKTLASTSFDEIAALVSVQRGSPPELMGMLSRIRDLMTEKLAPASQQSRLLENLDDIFECCSGSDPLSWELDVVLKVLDSSLDGEGGGKHREADDVNLVGKITSKEKDVNTEPTDSARHHASANTLVGNSYSRLLLNLWLVTSRIYQNA
ncbi:MAG: hypothetical protein Q9221_006851 [Calogaya cf. arnoldii]